MSNSAQGGEGNAFPEGGDLPAQRDGISSTKLLSVPQGSVRVPALFHLPPSALNGGTGLRGTVGTAGDSASTRGDQRWQDGLERLSEEQHEGLAYGDHLQEDEGDVIPFSSTLEWPHLECCVRLWAAQSERDMDMLQ